MEYNSSLFELSDNGAPQFQLEEPSPSTDLKDVDLLELACEPSAAKKKNGNYRGPDQHS
jgi:hypothetical protein